MEGHNRHNILLSFDLGALYVLFAVFCNSTVTLLSSHLFRLSTTAEGFRVSTGGSLANASMPATYNLHGFTFTI